MTAAALVASTQALDALSLLLARDHGTEMNPVGAWLLAEFGFLFVLALKVAVGAACGYIAYRNVPRAVPILSLMGCVGALSALVALL